MSQPRAPALRLTASRAAWERARELLFEGTQAYSKLPCMHVEGVAPVFAQRASGAWVWDVDGQRYLDLAAGLGAVLLGHADPEVNEAVVRALADGTQLSLAHPLELEVAETLRSLLPVAERVRFFKTGADAVSAAIRVARAVTGRTLVVRGRYHGWHDWAMAGAARGAGIPAPLSRDVVVLPQLAVRAVEDALAEHRGAVAAVCIEPMDLSPAPAGILREIAEATRRAGALLVVDEVATGFRFGVAGVQGREGVVPDLATFGKALANGFPLGVMAGRREVLDAAAGRVFVSSTFAGDTAALAAATVVLRRLSRTDAIPALERAGRQAIAALESPSAIGGGYALEVLGVPARFGIDVSGPDRRTAHQLKSIFYQETVRRGVLLGRACYPMACWTGEHVEAFGTATSAAAKVLQAAVASGSVEEWLDGAPLGEVPVR